MSLQTGFLILFLAITKSSRFEFTGQKHNLLTSSLCSFPQTDFVYGSLLSHDKQKAIQKSANFNIPSPFSLLLAYLVFWSTGHLFTSIINFSQHDSIYLIRVVLKSRMTVAICVSFGRHSIFITVSLPNMLRYQNFQEFITSCMDWKPFS